MSPVEFAEVGRAEETEAEIERRLEGELGGILQRFASMASMAFGFSDVTGTRAVGGLCPLSRRPPRNCWLCFSVSTPCGKRYAVQREAQVWDGEGRVLGLTRTCALTNRAAAASAWTEALREAVGAIVRREAALRRQRSELTAAYDELRMASRLAESLRGLEQEREIGETVVAQVADALPAEAVALLAGGEDGAFPHVVAARGLSEHELVQLVARCGGLAQLRAPQLMRGVPLELRAVEVGLNTWTGPALITVSAAGERAITVLVAARKRPEADFGEREQRLATMAVRHASLALASIGLRDRLHSLFMSTVRALAAAVDAKDPYTRGHSQRVAALAVAVGQALDLPEKQIERLQLAGLMHDLGKIGVHTSILLKPGSLETHEWEAIKLHPSRGAEILGCIPELADIVEAVKYHHERLDGSGYPEGLRGDEIPLFARIIAVCDAYDAMTSERPYRPPMTPAQAIGELRQAVKQYDQRIVATLAQVLDGEFGQLDAATQKAA